MFWLSRCVRSEITFTLYFRVEIVFRKACDAHPYPATTMVGLGVSVCGTRLGSTEKHRIHDIVYLFILNRIFRMSCPNVNRYKGSRYTKSDSQESIALHNQVQQRLRERELQDTRLFPAATAAATATAATAAGSSMPPVSFPGAKDSPKKT